MNKKINLWLFILIAVMLVTCKKEPLPQSSTAGQPVFSFTGSINSNSVNWQAGVNNYYMYSSYSQDTLPGNSGVYSFIGNLQSTSTNKNSIQFIINDDSAVALGAPSNFSKSVKVGSYFYNIPSGRNDTTGYSVTFTPILVGTANTYSYSFGDGYTSTIASPTHTYSTVGTYTTSLTVGFSCGSITLSNPIKIVKTKPQLMITSTTYTLVGVGRDSSNHEDTATVKFTGNIVSDGNSPYTYSWNFGDGNTSTSSSNSASSSVTHTYSDTNFRLFTVIFSASDNTGFSQSYYYNFIDTASLDCRLNYKMTAPSPVLGLLPLVTIIYTDAGGNIWTSDNAFQSGATFQINSVTSYKNNLSNEPTKILNITFNCDLYNGSINSSIPASGTAIIAVAYH